MNQRALAGRHALITGAAAGIGRATALALAAVGVAVEAADRDEAGLASLADAITSAGGQARPRVVDLGRPAEVEPLVAHIEAQAGPIDLLLNVAGIGLRASVLQMTPDDLRRLFEVNFFAAATLCREALRIMSERRRGHILNVSSAAARRGLPMMSAYAATKGALHGFTQSLRLEARPVGVIVTEVLPISTRTAFFETATNRAGQPYRPRGLVQTPEYVAERILACIRHPVAELHTTPLLRPVFALEALAPNLVERLAEWHYRMKSNE
jgi:short-subunit dehydrogenase